MKFKRANIEKALNNLIHIEQWIIGFLKSVEDQIWTFWGISSFHPMPTAIGTPTYKLAKFCDQLLKLITRNVYTIKDTFSSFDIKSLFSNIPITETLNVYVQNNYRNQTWQFRNLTKSSFYDLLKITMLETFFRFHGEC